MKCFGLRSSSFEIRLEGICLNDSLVEYVFVGCVVHICIYVVVRVYMCVHVSGNIVRESINNLKETTVSLDTHAVSLRWMLIVVVVLDAYCLYGVVVVACSVFFCIVHSKFGIVCMRAPLTRIYVDDSF